MKKVDLFMPTAQFWFVCFFFFVSQDQSQMPANYFYIFITKARKPLRLVFVQLTMGARSRGYISTWTKGDELPAETQNTHKQKASD